MHTLQAKGHSLQLPVFFPDATYGFVRSLSSEDLRERRCPGRGNEQFPSDAKTGLNRHFCPWGIA